MSSGTDGGSQQARVLDLFAQERSRLSPVIHRVLDAGETIFGAEADDIAYLHSTLAMCSLPYRRPAGEIMEFERRNGRASLLITAGKLMDPRTGGWVQQGLPFGPRARLILVHLCSEALRHRSQVVEVGDSMSAFMRQLGIQPTGGRKGTISNFKEQINRLAAARMQIGLWSGDQSMSLEAKPIKSINIWFPDDPRQRILWNSTIVLDPTFYESLQRFAVPLDPRAIAALKHNSLALDIYAWLAHRLHRVRAATGDFVPWTSLYSQFGETYDRPRDFRVRFRAALRQATAVYPAAKLEETGPGLKLFPSTPPIAKRLVAVRSLESLPAASHPGAALPRSG